MLARTLSVGKVAASRSTLHYNLSRCQDTCTVQNARTAPPCPLTAPSSPGLLVGVGLWEYQLEALGQAFSRRSETFPQVSKHYLIALQASSFDFKASGSDFEASMSGSKIEPFSHRSEY